MARGIEHRRIFRTERDRVDFGERLSSLARSGLITVSVGVLLPNRVHLLVRTGSAPWAHAMRALLTDSPAPRRTCVDSRNGGRRF